MRCLSHSAIGAGLTLLVLLTGRAALADSLESGGVRVVFPPRARKKAERLVHHFVASRQSAARWLGLEVAGSPVLHLVDGHGEMVRIAGPGVPQWAIAVSLPSDRLAFRLDLLDTTPRNSVSLVAAHEAVHQVLNHLRGPPLRRPPRWFEEGLCVYHAGLPWFEPDASLERIAAAGRLPSFADAEKGFGGTQGEAAVSYGLGHSVVLSLVARYGNRATRRVLHHFQNGLSFEAAFRRTTGIDLDAFEERWRYEITPRVPLVLFVVLQNIELALLCLAALLVAGAYVRWRLRRERAMQSLEDQSP